MFSSVFRQLVEKGICKKMSTEKVNANTKYKYKLQREKRQREESDLFFHE